MCIFYNKFNILLAGQLSKKIPFEKTLIEYYKNLLDKYNLLSQQELLDILSIGKIKKEELLIDFGVFVDEEEKKGMSAAAPACCSRKR